jgi:hypothetical protein
MPFEANIAELQTFWNDENLTSSNVRETFSRLIDEVRFTEVVDAIQEDECKLCKESQTRIEASLRNLVTSTLNVRIVD